MKIWKLVNVFGLIALIQEAHGLLPNIKWFKQQKPYLRMGGYDATIGTNPSSSLQFFTTPGNTCPFAARTYIVLEELQIPFDTTEVSIRDKPDWYLNINPKGKVPAIRLPGLDNLVVYESAICCEFLCDYSTTRLNAPTTLMPEDAIERASIRLLNEHFDSVLVKSQFAFLMNKDETNDEELLKEMEEGLMLYEKALEKRGGPYLMGKHFTLSDVHFLPFFLRLSVSLRHYKNYELPPHKFPMVLAWFDICSQRNSVKGAALTDEKIIEGYRKFVP